MAVEDTEPQQASQFSLRTNAGFVLQTFNEHLPQKATFNVGKVNVTVPTETNQLTPYPYMWQKQEHVVNSTLSFSLLVVIFDGFLVLIIC